MSEPTEIADDIIKQIQARMEEKGMNKAALAASLGVTPGYVSHLFKGRKQNMTLATLDKLARAVDLEVEVNIT